MNQSDLDTATLIRRLTEDLEASKAECARQERGAQMKFDAIALERDRLRSMHNDLQELHAQQRSRAGKVEAALDARLKTLAGFQLELDAKKAENESLRRQLAERDQKIEWQQGVIRTADSAYVRLEEERDSLRARAERAEKEAAISGKAHELVHDALMKFKARAEGAEADLAAARSQRDVNARMAAESEAIAQRALNERDEARRESKSWARTANEALASADDYQKKWHAAESRSATFRDECIDLRDKTVKQIARLGVVQSERDEAREQLAKVEWSGAVCPTCPLCYGQKPGTEWYGIKPPFGHASECWFSKQRATIPADTMAAGSQVRISVEFKPEPARPEPKFKVGQSVQHAEKIGAVLKSTWHPLFSCWTYTIDGFECDISESSLVPAPRFSVGDWAAYRTEAAQIAAGLWDPKLGQWFYATNGFTNVAESALSRVPAPKFAVGEWATSGGRSFEISSREFVRAIGWLYGDSKAGGFCTEDELTAQAPQHKHTCGAGACAFLGRLDGTDLYWCSRGFPIARYGSHPTDETGYDRDPRNIEACRRAKLRGLIK